MSCLSQTPPLGGLSPPQGVFQGHAAHLAEWSAKLRPKGSWGTCIPQGVTTFFYTAFTAHSDVGAEAIGGRLQAGVRLGLTAVSQVLPTPGPRFPLGADKAIPPSALANPGSSPD